MVRLVRAEEVEEIFGDVDRHEIKHIGKAVIDGDQGQVYILHSKRCVVKFADLRDCPYSQALRNGIYEWRWASYENQPVFLGILKGRLEPWPYIGEQQ